MIVNENKEIVEFEIGDLVQPRSEGLFKFGVVVGTKDHFQRLYKVYVWFPDVRKLVVANAADQQYYFTKHQLKEPSIINE